MRNNSPTDKGNPNKKMITTRQLEDEEADVDDDNRQTGAYLTCNWRWEEADEIEDDDDDATMSNVTEAPMIIQNCGYLIPDYSYASNADGYIGYRTKSVCVYENVNATKFDCNVTDYYGASPTYSATCSVSALAKNQSVDTACQSQTSWIPIQESQCQDCWRRYRYLNIAEEPGRHLASEECQRCKSEKETCRSFTFGTSTISSDIQRQDYNGIPWSYTLIETMKSEYAAGNNHVNGSDLENVILYDISADQPSLLAEDFALGMAFDCDSGRYLDASLSKQTLSDSGGAWVLGAVVSTMVLSGAALIWLILHRSSGPTLSDGDLRTSRLIDDHYNSTHDKANRGVFI